MIHSSTMFTFLIQSIKACTYLCDSLYHLVDDNSPVLRFAAMWNNGASRAFRIT